MKAKNLILLLVTLFLYSCNKDPEVLPKFYPFLIPLEVSDLDQNGVTLHARFIEGLDSISEYGFIFSLNETVLKNHKGISLPAVVNGDQLSLRLEGPTIKGHEIYYFRPFLKTKAGFSIYGHSSSFEFEGPGYQVSDVDGNSYKCVQIGDFIWMTENLRTTRYSNGDPLYSDLTNWQWENISAGAFSIYPYDLVTGFGSSDQIISAFGKLYNWHAVADERGLCPAGWRVPTDDDWKYLEGYVDSEYGIGHPIWDQMPWNGRGKDAGWKLKTKFFAEFKNFYGSDEYGFSARPGGFRRINGLYSEAISRANFWTSTQFESNRSIMRRLETGSYSSRIKRDHWDKNAGLSVRCIKIME